MNIYLAIFLRNFRSIGTFIAWTSNVSVIKTTTGKVIQGIAVAVGGVRTAMKSPVVRIRVRSGARRVCKTKVRVNSF